ncbi:MAG: LarC family nickel insertion protein [Betaproteobacteria bacterium]
MQIHLDAIGGVAGDMFIAATLDAFPAFAEPMFTAIRAAGLPETITCRVADHRDHALTGLRFLVEEPAYREREAGSRELGGTHHRHVPFRDIKAQLERASLSASVRTRAIQMFSLLAEAESQVHGATPEEVSFHELGGWDSIADIVGAAFLIDALNADAWTVSALPQGSGRVKTDHGWLPVPVPATTLLLKGFEFFDDGLQGERVTPTGAAILRHLNAAQHRAGSRRRLLQTGSGFGTKTFPGLSNVLRLLAFDEALSEVTRDEVAQIAFEVDDQTAEDLAIGLDRLRAHPGVLDVLQIPAFGKKGRMAAHIQLLADPAQMESVFEACFTETATIGLRWQVVNRSILPRANAHADVDGRRIRIKTAQRPTVDTVKAESDDLRAIDGGRQQRDGVRRRAEQAGLVEDANERTD